MRVSTEEESAMSETLEKLDFETTLNELERVVTELDGEVKLEKALDLFNRGMKLSGDCQKFLQAAEQQVELLRRTADGSLKTTPFAEEDEAAVGSGSV
jgi:exodeoxyribonuclease VII small subunit